MESCQLFLKIGGKRCTHWKNRNFVNGSRVYTRCQLKPLGNLVTRFWLDSKVQKSYVEKTLRKATAATPVIPSLTFQHLLQQSRLAEKRTLALEAYIIMTQTVINEWIAGRELTFCVREKSFCSDISDPLLGLELLSAPKMPDFIFFEFKRNFTNILALIWNNTFLYKGKEIRNKDYKNVFEHSFTENVSNEF